MGSPEKPVVLSVELCAVFGKMAYRDALAVCGADDQPFLAEQVAMQFSELVAQAMELRGPKGRYYLLVSAEGAP